MLNENVDESAKEFFSLPIKTELCFVQGDDDMSDAWRLLCENENVLAHALANQPMGKIVFGDSLAWKLIVINGERVLHHVTTVAGQVAIDAEWESRFDIGLEWVDFEEADLRHYAVSVWRVTELMNGQENEVTSATFNIPSKKGGSVTLSLDVLEDVLNRFNTVCQLSARLCNEMQDAPEKVAREFDTEELRHHSISDYSTEIRQELHDLIEDLKASAVNQ